MKKRLSWKKISAIGAGAVMAMSLAFGMGFSNLFANSSVNDAADGKTTQNVEGGGTNREVNSYATSTNTLTRDAASGLNLYSTGSTYWYTDYAEGLKYAGGTAGVSTDRITVTVDNKSSNKGTAANPYVIDSKADWNAFVNFVKGNEGNEAAQSFVYVLNRDLDYNTAAEGAAVVHGEIKSVSTFSGTFYGNGHTISNVKYNPVNAKSSSALGLFCHVPFTGTAYFSDLTIKNLKIDGGVIGHCGGILGHSDGDITFTGITVTGNFTATDPVKENVNAIDPLSVYISYGGLLGVGHYEGKTLNIYKCSADIDLSISTSATNIWSGIGGLVGLYDGYSNWVNEDDGYSSLGDCEALNVYDCYSAVNLTYNGYPDAVAYPLWTGVIGFLRDTLTVNMKRCMSIYNITASATSMNMRPGLLFSLGQAHRLENNVYNIDACYGYGNFQQGTTKTGIPLVGLHSETGGYEFNDTIENCKIYSDYAGFCCDAAPMGGKAESVNDAPAASLDAFKNAAKSKLNNPSVWSSGAIDAINGTTDTPDIAETPMVVSKTKITFNNVDDTALALSDGTGNVREYAPNQVGVDLPTPTAQTGKEFVGWTLDKSSEATKHTTFPDKLYGNVTMYPVFNMTGVSVAVTPSGTGINAGDTTITKDYTGASVVTLTAALTLPAGVNASDCTITWSWYKGDDKITGATTNVLTLSEQTTGTYYAKVNVVHNSKLWRTAGDIQSTQQFEITIGKGVLTFESATVSPTQTAFVGQSLTQANNKLEIVANIRNSGGLLVTGKASWKVGGTVIEGTDSRTYPATFQVIKGDGTNDENYDAIDIEVTVVPTQLRFIFELDPDTFTDTSFSIPVDYGQSLTGSEIVEEFEEAYFDLLDKKNPTLNGKTPMLGGKYIYKYLEDNASATVTTFSKSAPEDVLTNYTMSVTFSVPTPAPYTVTFDTDIAGTTVSSQPVYYGQKVTVPELNRVGTGEDSKFLQGWFVVTGGEMAEEAFNFDTRLKGNITLKAQWEQGTLEFVRIEAKLAQSNAQFTATTQPLKSQYVVTGVYNVTVGEENKGEFKQQLTEDQFSLTYAGGSTYQVSNEANLKKITVTYTGEASGSATTQADVNITVIPKRIYLDNTKTIFKDGAATVPATGLYRKITSGTFVFRDNNGEVTLTSGAYSTTYTYTKEGGGVAATLVNNEGEGGVNEIGWYNVRVEFTFINNNYTTDSTISARFEIKDQAKQVVVVWSSAGSQTIDGKIVYTYNGTVQHPTATFYEFVNGEKTEKVIPLYVGESFDYKGNVNSKVASGAVPYEIGVELKTISYELVLENSDFPTMISYSIAKARVAYPMATRTEFTYTGSPIDICDSLRYSADELANMVAVASPTQTNVLAGGGSYTSVVTLRDTDNSEWDVETGNSDPVSITWKILPKQILAPMLNLTKFTYKGADYQIKDYLGLDEAVYISGDHTKSEVGKYTVTLSFTGVDGIPNENYVWADTKNKADREVEWEITKRSLRLTWSDRYLVKYEINGSTRPTILGYEGLADSDRMNKTIDLSKAFVYEGAYASAPGTYTVKAYITSNTDYGWLKKNYEINKSSETLYWVIKGSEDEQIIRLLWNVPAKGYYTFNEQVQAPEVVGINDEENNTLLDFEDYIISYDKPRDTMWAGQYSLTATVTSKAEPNKQFRIVQDTVSYNIVPNGTQGNNPADQPNAGDNNNNNSTDGNNQGGATGDTPSNGFVTDLPQIAISAVSAVLIVVFVIMSLNYSSTAKDAKRKAKKLAQMSYSFAPFGLLVALGISSSNWWIVAGILMGLALLSAIVMFMMRGKAKKALLMLEEEQDRIEEEKEMARQERENQQAMLAAQQREEQQRRDSEFKMMFAAMQQSYQQPQIDYEGMQNMISSAVSALLPGLQQQAALPPAQSENDELRAQMARQEEMINQLLQERQQGYGAPAQEAAAAQDYADPVFDSQSDGAVSLEESYGKLSDDFKRFYYEVGVYIMGKPETAQNDGKYAVLFKYRGKTSFKLSIKNGAPVLAYIMNDAPSEISIISDAALTYAKQIVDMCLNQIDG